MLAGHFCHIQLASAARGTARHPAIQKKKKNQILQTNVGGKNKSMGPCVTADSAHPQLGVGENREESKRSKYCKNYDKK